MFPSDLFKQPLHASVPFDRVVRARVRGSAAKVNIGIANRKIFRELCVCTEMASADRLIGDFPGPPAIGVTTVAPDAAARAESEYNQNHKAWPTPHPMHLSRILVIALIGSSLRLPFARVTTELPVRHQIVG